MTQNSNQRDELAKGIMGMAFMARVIWGAFFFLWLTYALFPNITIWLEIIFHGR